VVIEAMGEGVDEGLELVEAIGQIEASIELVAPGTLGAFDGAVELGPFGRQHEEEDALLGAGLRNHADAIASIDLFVVPTISFRLLYDLLILQRDRRQILWLGVTAHPTAEWLARQLTEACGWNFVRQYLIRDRDRVYSEYFTRRLRAMGIHDRPTAPLSPWQNGHCERPIGSIRRECLDRVVVFSERHLRQLLLSYNQTCPPCHWLLPTCAAVSRWFPLTRTYSG
jgi:hypothetical protein